MTSSALTIRQVATKRFSLLSYIIEDESSGEILVIDPPWNIGKHLNKASRRVTTVINTHYHLDHILGNPWFRHSCPVMAHKGDGSPGMRGMGDIASILLTRSIPPHVRFCLKDKGTISLGEQKIHIIHTPGHSPGSICLYWDGNLISGDTVFAGGIGRTDIPGGDRTKMKKSLEQIMGLPDNTIIWPGHFYSNRYNVSLGKNRPAIARAMDTL
ncbi:MAG: MBL fold metallo-hydrolase [Thermodesulfobacteriota bacterium]|nr:MBL fold metallo-hydrolase [Thermodesulfobacteriota bacterium]